MLLWSLCRENSCRKIVAIRSKRASFVARRRRFFCAASAADFGGTSANLPGVSVCVCVCVCRCAWGALSHLPLPQSIPSVFASSRRASCGRLEAAVSAAAQSASVWDSSPTHWCLPPAVRPKMHEMFHLSNVRRCSCGAGGDWQAAVKFRGKKVCWISTASPVLSFDRSVTGGDLEVAMYHLVDMATLHHEASCWRKRKRRRSRRIGWNTPDSHSKSLEMTLGLFQPSGHLYQFYIHDGPKKVEPQHLKTHIFCLHLQNAYPISMVFGILQCRFILNTSADSKFVKLTKQIGATWRNLITLMLLSMNDKGS